MSIKYQHYQFLIKMLHINKTKSCLNIERFAFFKRCVSQHKSFGSQSASSVTNPIEHVEEIKEQPSKKLPHRLPLVKNFFVGLVDKELLGFPEVINREDMARLKNDILPLKKYFSEDFDSFKASATHTLPAGLVDNLKELGLYGTNVSVQFDGKGWGYSESLMASEPESEATDVALSLLGHRCVVDIIQELGSTEQKQRFLTKLANGKDKSAFTFIIKIRIYVCVYFKAHLSHQKPFLNLKRLKMIFLIQKPNRILKHRVGY